MKRELNIFVRLAAALSTIVVALVAIRRIFLDLQDILGIKVKIERSTVAGAYKDMQKQLLQNLTAPLQPGGLALGVIKENKSWHTPLAMQATLQPSARESNPHALILGRSDTVRSDYLTSLIQQDIEADDRAVIVLDTDGEITDHLVAWMKSHPDNAKFAERTTVFAPAEESCSLGLNPMFVAPGKSRTVVADAIVTAFQSMSAPAGSQYQLNAQTTNILRNSVILLMACGKPITDLQKLLCDTDFRDVALATLSEQKGESADYQLLVDSWNQYKKLMRTDQWIVWIEPILTRVGTIAADDIVCHTLNKLFGHINLTKVVAQKHIVLVKLDARPVSKFISSLIASQLQEAVAKIPRPTALYVDRLDAGLSADSFTTITRENQTTVGIIGTVQSLHNLPAVFRESMLTTAGYVLSFAISQKDAELIAPIVFKGDDKSADGATASLTNLKPDELYCGSLHGKGAVKIAVNLAARGHKERDKLSDRV